MWDLRLTSCYLQESRGRLNEIVKIYSLTRGPYATHVSRSHLLSVCPLVGQEAPMQDIRTERKSPDCLICILMGLTGGKQRSREGK